MSDAVIRLEGIGKKYHLSQDGPPSTRLREILTSGLRRLGHRLRPAFAGRPPAAPARGREFWALKDVSFEVRPGEAVGFVGRNGAGKSTLLKIISRITAPTEGRMTLRGRVVSLLEVGTGFHPDLTGRENIYLGGAILGLKRNEIRKKFDEIIAFAEIDRFLDTPVKFYSSGMYTRLAFAVAANLDPEILILDEVLAVGDSQFQKKCLNKMSTVAGEGRAVLFVSHDTSAVQRFCARVVLLDSGRVVADGGPSQILEKYHAPAALKPTRGGDEAVRWTAIALQHPDGRPCAEVRSGAPLVIRMGYQTARPFKPTDQILVTIGIQHLQESVWFACCNDLTNQIRSGWPAEGYVKCLIPRLPLSPGFYRANLYVAVNGILADYVADAIILDVKEGDFFGNGHVPTVARAAFAGLPLLVHHSWQLEEGTAAAAA